MDRISQLPDNILNHILSFVGIKTAVRTSVLSRTWQNVWTSKRNLGFSDCYRRGDRNANIRRELYFMDFVSRVLIWSEAKCLKSFYLRRTGADLDDDFNFVNTWVCTAIKRCVQDLSLYYIRNPIQAVSLPCVLFKSTSLVVLKLERDVLLQVPDLVSLPSLKELYLLKIHYENDGSAPKLFAACPVLEKLVITRANYDNMLVLNISIDTLKSLHLKFLSPARMGVIVVDGDENGDDIIISRRLIINAPKLEDFHLEDFMSEHLLLNNCISLSKAFIDVGGRYKSHVRATFEDSTEKLLWEVRNVKILSFTTQMMKYLTSHYRGRLPPFRNLIRLEVGVGNGLCWKKLFQFLESLPELQVLIIEKAATRSISRRHANWTPPQLVPNCLLDLKEIVIKQYQGKELEVVKYILMNAEALEEIRIKSPRFQRAIINEIEENLESLPMASENCKMIFNGKTLEAKYAHG